MKILIVNKFLHPNGGSETYIFELGKQLLEMGHRVEYFGMEHPMRIVGNQCGAYTQNMDFHQGSKLKKLSYAMKTIYSPQARKKIRLVLEAFGPDVLHLNNFNFQLTPSVILEARKWARQNKRPLRIVYTAHDYQLICPNHMMRNPRTNANCSLCVKGRFHHCLHDRCIHGSRLKSLIGMMEGYFWKLMGIYRHIDAVICPSEFMKRTLDQNPVFASKTLALHNFVQEVSLPEIHKRDYILYFGRFSEEKGTRTLVSVCRQLPEIRFIFAGSGPLEHILETSDNIQNVGFQTGEALHKLIREARLCVYPSECYENCPFSVMESQQYGTPVLGANIGGIPELIQDQKTGELFESGNADDLKKKIKALYDDPDRLALYSKNYKQTNFDTVATYCGKILTIYKGVQDE